MGTNGSGRGGAAPATATAHDETYRAFEKAVKELRLLGSTSALLSWDQETYMPPAGGEWRAEQLALVAGLVHERLVSNAMGEMLESLRAEGASGDLGFERATNVRELARSVERERKLPADLVREIARTQSLAQEAWVKARKASDFAAFAPLLERTVALKRQVAELLGFDRAGGGEIYDALLDEFEPGARTRDLVPVFERLRDTLVALVRRIQASPRKPDTSILRRRYPIDGQREFAQRVARDMGFDFDAGRIDVSAHPFCSGLWPRDVRLTTRYDEHDGKMALFGVLHEAGHGLYEQGLDARFTGTPMAEAVSSGIHESQSRLWENQVGRGRAFWKFYYPKLQAQFAEALGDVPAESFHAAINAVAPSLIRVEADEVTYNLHILLRFELERDLIAGRIQVGDLPSLWNRKMNEYLGLTPPDDARGVLQDVHWSLGYFGYFPTYALGNLYAAQFYARAGEEIGNLHLKIGRGELLPLRDWLRERIHRHGMRWRAHELVREVTKKPLGSEAFESYLEAKFGELYGI